jgi:hypothetical protein
MPELRITVNMVVTTVDGVVDTTDAVHDDLKSSIET